MLSGVLTPPLRLRVGRQVMHQLSVLPLKLSCFSFLFGVCHCGCKPWSAVWGCCSCSEQPQLPCLEGSGHSSECGSWGRFWSRSMRSSSREGQGQGDPCHVCSFQWCSQGQKWPQGQHEAVCWKAAPSGMKGSSSYEPSAQDSHREGGRSERRKTREKKTRQIAISSSKHHRSLSWSLGTTQAP